MATGKTYLRLGRSATAASSTVRWRAHERAFDRLTDRERQVLTLVAGGRSNRQVAAILGLSANTVAVHRAKVMKTLAVRKAAALVLLAVRHGLVSLDGVGIDPRGDSAAKK